MEIGVEKVLMDEMMKRVRVWILVVLNKWSLNACMVCTG